MKVRVKNKVLNIPDEIVKNPEICSKIFSHIIIFKTLGFDQNIIKNTQIFYKKEYFRTYSFYIIPITIFYIYKKYKNKLILQKPSIPSLLITSTKNKEIYNILIKIMNILIKYIKTIYNSILLLVKKYNNLRTRYSLYLLNVLRYPDLTFEYLKKEHEKILTISKTVLGVDFKNYIYDNRYKITLILKFIQNTFQKLKNNLLKKDYKAAFNTLFTYIEEMGKYNKIIKEILKINTKYKLKTILNDDYTLYYDLTL